MARAPVFRRLSIQSKLILMLVLCTVLAAAVVGVIAYKNGRDALRAASISRLTETREAQGRALAEQISFMRSALAIYAGGVTAQSALRDFTAAFDQLANSQITPEQQKAIEAYYNGEFAKHTERYTGTRLNVPALLPRTNAEKYLQANYTAKLPTNEAALAAFDAGDGSAWSAANARYHRYFSEIATRFDFEDALIIDDRGNVVYSVYKDVDLGTNILNGPYRGSELREAFIEATSSNKADQVVLTDFELYQPATMAPTAWMVAPIPAEGPAAGAVALQLPITRINKLMTFDKQWSASGLGQTGETILVGEDLLMRSNSRLFLEDPQKYRDKVINAGTPPDIADIAIRQGGTMLVQPVPPDATVAAAKGQAGTMITTDYLGEKTLQAYSQIPGDTDPRWVIIAKITTAEAFSPEATFTRTVVLATTGIIFGVCLLAILLARVFLRPIRRLQSGVQRISAGDYRVQIPVETRDEIGDLTQGFNEMSRGLTVKDELVDAHRQQIRHLLGSLMPAPIAEKFGSGEEIVARAHPNVTVIFAEVGGLDRIQAEMDAVDSLNVVNELQRQFDAAAAEFGVDRVRAVRNAYLGSCGLTAPRLDHVRQTVDFALECQHIIDRFNSENGLDLSLRAGIDTGTVNSGLVGEPALIFDLWGSAVNLTHQIIGGAPGPGVYVTSRVYETLSASLPFVSAGSIGTDDGSEPVWRVTEEA